MFWQYWLAPRRRVWAKGLGLVIVALWIGNSARSIAMNRWTCDFFGELQRALDVTDTRVQHQTARELWTAPIRAIWAPGSDGILAGSSDHGCYIYCLEQRARPMRLSSDCMQEVPSRIAAHPSGELVACGVASGHVHIFST